MDAHAHAHAHIYSFRKEFIKNDKINSWLFLNICFPRLEAIIVAAKVEKTDDEIESVE